MKVTRALVTAAVIGLVASVAAELVLIDREHVHAPFSYGDVPGVWVLFGFVWALALIFVPKWVGHSFLMKHHDPYTGEVVRETRDREEPHE